MEAKWANASELKNLGENRIFSPLRLGYKAIEKQFPSGLKLLSYISINYACVSAVAYIRMFMQTVSHKSKHGSTYEGTENFCC